MRIHLEGMGIVGSLLALKLEQQGFKFTWNDIDAPINAWRASTGCVYPSGDEFDMINYEFWRAEFFGRLPEYEEATYCFLSKHPPHGGKYPFSRQGVFGVSKLPSLHLNAQLLVFRVRKRFQEQRLAQSPKGAQTIVTHGFGPRLHHVLWGWTKAVKLSSSPVQLQPGTFRECYYMRVGRFKLAYAYPIPQTKWYYAGSSLIVQKKVKSLRVLPKFERWQQHVLEHTGLKVIEVGKTAEGWRPAAAPEDDRLLRVMNERWVLKPMWSSGIRHAPALCKAVLEKL